MLKGNDIICFAGEDWWYHNPHSNLHIMKSLAKENRILFVNSIGTRMPDFKNDKFVWKKIFSKIKSILKFLKKAEKNIYVFSPIALPPIEKFEEFARAFNKFFLHIQFKLIFFLLNIKKPILWVSIPTANEIVFYINSKKAKCMVYYCVDNISHYSNTFSEIVLRSEIELHKRADVAFFVNHQLVDERKIYNSNTHYLSHGADFDHFFKAHEIYDKIPSDLDSMPSPIVAYIGEIRYLDFNLVEFLANRHKEISFVFIGSVHSDIERFKSMPNVYFLGKKRYEDLPLYMQKVACYAIYYERNSVFNNYRNPKKLLEYLATGKPIISVPLLELKYFPDLVYIAENYELFDQCLKEALESDSLVKKNNRIRYAKEHTWDMVGKEVSKHIMDVLSK